MFSTAGGLLDYEAVRQGLSSGRITGLGLDVQEQEPVDPQHWLAQHPRWAGGGEAATAGVVAAAWGLAGRAAVCC